MRPCVLSLAFLLTAGAAGAPCQTARNVAPIGPGEDLVRAGDEAHVGLLPARALEAYLRVLAAEPDRYDALWRAAREAVNLGMLATDGARRKGRYSEAEEYARRARAAAPAGVEGAEWLAIALGRQALEQGPRGRVRYAVQVRDAALAALALDSANAGAHHVLGEWHAEVRRLSRVERWVARELLGGGILGEASWEEAEAHLSRAVVLDPSGLIHHLNLARVYLDTGRLDEARECLRQVLERPAAEPVDPLHKQEAQRLLQALR